MNRLVIQVLAVVLMIGVSVALAPALQADDAQHKDHHHHHGHKHFRHGKHSHSCEANKGCMTKVECGKKCEHHGQTAPCKCGESCPAPTGKPCPCGCSKGPAVEPAAPCKCGKSCPTLTGKACACGCEKGPGVEPVATPEAGAAPAPAPAVEPGQLSPSMQRLMEKVNELRQRRGDVK
ncbi:MAG: hypothetical protein HY815_16310 [Candidatus Riflebacteria bacterium]|nr:hypothetical protein [Candidatus Riflebacteria bacterium]